MAGRISYLGGIVRDGLVLHLDAAKKDSYDGTGTTWRDLSPSQTNGTLTNGPTFNSDNGGSIVFDGTNDYIQLPSNSILNFCNATNDLPFSISTWCYINSLSNIFRLYNKGDNGDGVLQSYASAVSTTGKYYVTLYDTNGTNQTSAVTTDNIPTGTWVNLLHTYLGTGGYSGLKLYVNGVAQTTTIAAFGTYTRMRVQSTNLFLGSFGSTGVYREIRSNGRYGFFQFYNKELTTQEVLQNYNATKGRYGL